MTEGLRTQQMLEQQQGQLLTPKPRSVEAAAKIVFTSFDVQLETVSPITLDDGRVVEGHTILGSS